MSIHKITHKTPKALLLLDKNATLGRVSHGTHVDSSYISLIFNGKRTPSLPCAARLAAYLGCSIDKLYAVLQSIKVDKSKR